MTAPTLPSFVLTGTVVNQWMVAGVDTAGDADTAPDVFYPAGSTLQFDPSVTELTFAHNGTDRPHGLTLTLEQVIAQVDGSGQIITPDGSPLSLVANIGQTANAQAWHWTCTPRISGVRKDPFIFNVTAGAVNYLSEQMSVKTAAAMVAALLGPKGDPGVNTPPPGTPNGYVATAVGGVVTYAAPAASTGGVAADTDGVPYVTF